MASCSRWSATGAFRSSARAPACGRSSTSTTPQATALAVQRGAPGLYNIVDDEPAPVATWLPYLAEMLHAPAPRRIPRWPGRLALEPVGVSWMTDIRGSSNAKAKHELGWHPRYPSWRDGFRQGLTPLAGAAVNGRPSVAG